MMYRRNPNTECLLTGKALAAGESRVKFTRSTPMAGALSLADFIAVGLLFVAVSTASGETYTPGEEINKDFASFAKNIS